MIPTDTSVGFDRCSEEIRYPAPPCWRRTGNMDKRQAHEEVAFKPTLKKEYVRFRHAEMGVG